MNRKTEIISLIAQYNNITGKELANIMGCSLKTVQTTIKDINSQYNIICATVDGYKFSNNYFNTVIEFEDEENDDNYILSQLLLYNQKLDIDELADSLYMSRTSIERKLNSIKSFLIGFNIQLIKSKNRIFVDGKEEDKRAIISYLISQEADKDFSRTSTNEVTILDGIDANVIRNIVLNVTNKNGYIIRDCCFYGILANINIALYRCKVGSNVQYDTPVNNINDPLYIIAEQIYEEYNNIWPIVYYQGDIVYLVSLLKGQLLPKDKLESNNNVKLIIDEEFEKSIQEIVDTSFAYYGLSINSVDDDNFIYNFCVHVKLLIERAQNNNKVENEMLTTIQKNCPFIYEVAVYIYDKIKAKYNISISNEEIGYIAVHIGFLIQRSNKVCINVLLLTSSYSGINSNIKHQMIETYGDSINIIEDPNTFSKQAIDLIITNKNKNIFGTKTVVISPFFDENDRELVRDAINECNKIKNEIITDTIYATFLNDNLFFRNENIRNKDETLKFLTDQMIEQNIVEADFYSNVIQREELSSTCFFNSFAIPHGLYFNAKKSRCCILLSDEGIIWDDSLIHIVILIAVKYNDRHIFMKMYDSIIQALQNQKKLNEIVKASSLDEFLDIIKEAKR